MYGCVNTHTHAHQFTHMLNHTPTCTHKNQVYREECTVTHRQKHSRSCRNFGFLHESLFIKDLKVHKPPCALSEKSVQYLDFTLQPKTQLAMKSNVHLHGALFVSLHVELCASVIPGFCCYLLCFLLWE